MHKEGTKEKKILIFHKESLHTIYAEKKSSPKKSFMVKNKFTD